MFGILYTIYCMSEPIKTQNAAIGTAQQAAHTQKKEEHIPFPLNCLFSFFLLLVT